MHGFDSRNASSRSFNLIRSKLVALQRERGWRMLGIVSATPNVGKSFVSANVAAAMSRDPRFQTYLIDLDLRRGTIKDIFGIETDDGHRRISRRTTSRATACAGFIPQGQELIIIPSIAGPVHVGGVACRRARDRAVPRHAQLRRAQFLHLRPAAGLRQ